MAKAKKAKIKKAEQSTQLPLDDMRWRPVAEIVEKLLPHIGNKVLVAQDLTKALASEKIRCMRRHSNEHTLKIEKLSDEEINAILSAKAAGEMVRPTGHRELVPASFWNAYCYACSPHGDIRVGFRLPPTHDGPSGPSFTWTANWIFYLWLPDCVKVWPALIAQETDASEAEASEPLRSKPGPRAKGEWQWFVAMKVCTLKNSAKQLPTAGELAQLCQDELGYQPAETAINKLVRELKRLLG